MPILQTLPVTIELCCGGIDDVRLAVKAKVDRIELNCGMALSGLTPSACLTKASREVFSGPIVAMVRPREGGFCYSAAEFHQMLDETEWLLAEAMDGIATGFLTAEGTIDIARCAIIRARFSKATLVFHKAFDATPNLTQSLQQLVDCGFDRVLTSGGMCTASEGVDQLKQLREVAAGRIEVVAAGGIRASNVRSVTARSGCRQIHSAVRELAIDLSTRHNPSLSFALPGTPDGSYGQASELQLTQLLEAVVDLRTGPTDAHISRVIV